MVIFVRGVNDSMLSRCRMTPERRDSTGPFVCVVSFTERALTPELSTQPNWMDISSLVEVLAQRHDLVVQIDTNTTCT
jgi:hypothetical protein